MHVVSKVLCEEFRQEVTGKYMLLGVYRTCRAVNNLPKEKRWKDPMRFCFFVGVEVDRSNDAGSYFIRSTSSNGESLMQDIPLKINPEGDDFVQLPIIVLMNMKSAGDIVVNVYRNGDSEPLAELGRISVCEMD